MQYTGENCPVCGKAFAEGDDIVVCPTCGTPHHRTCYFEKEACANADRHAQGFAWASQQEKTVALAQPKKPDSHGHHILFCPNCGTENPAEEPVCKKCGTRLYNNPEGKPTPQIQLPDGSKQAFGVGTYTISPNEMLGENTVGDTAEYVRTGANKYIPKFFAMEKGKKKVSFNFAAFFFGPHWFFYRRMYAVGASILLFLLVLFGGTMTPRYIEKAKAMTDIVEQTMLSEEMSAEQQTEYVQAAQAFLALPEVQIRFALTTLVYVLSGVFGNTCYKRNAEKQVKKLRTSAANEQQYRIALFRSGGTSMAMACASFLILRAATQLITLWLMG